MQFSISYIPGAVVNNGDGTTDQYGAYYINSTDDSGNPVNGDNTIVQYQSVSSGPGGSTFGDVLSIAIPGLTRKIFDGVVQSRDSDFLSYAIVATDPGTPSPPTEPDLKIVSITVTKKADSSGNNGKVTIVASSSNSISSYNIDLALSYPSGVDIPVSAGPHTATVFDSEGNSVSQDFNVLKSDSILVSDPSLTIGGKVSRWNAAYNPIYFTYQRKDFDVAAIAQDDTTLKPAITINAILTGLTTDDYIYLDAGLSTTGVSTYKGAFKVLAINSNVVVIDTDYVAPDTISGFANIDALKPYYKVITKIKALNPLTGLFSTITSTNRPINGTTRADISSYLQALLYALPDLSDYTQVNFRDLGLGVSYQISYAETWEGNTPVFDDISTPFYATYAARQIQQRGGGNMFDCVTQDGGVQLAKWLTDFSEPSYSIGYPFDLPFIYSEQVAGRQLYYKIIALDINRQPLGDTEATSFLLNEDESYLLNQDGSKLIIARQQLVNTPIVEHVGVNRLLINQDFGPTCYYLNVQLFYDDEETPVPVTQPIIVRVDVVCPIEPVYVRWIGLNGGWNYFRFNYNQTKTLDVQNPVLVKDYISDYENAQGVERLVSKEASSKVQVYANGLDKQTIDGLQSIKYSPVVQILSNGNPIKWQTIILNASTFTEYETQSTKGKDGNDFGFTFNNPSINIQQN